MFAFLKRPIGAVTESRIKELMPVGYYVEAMEENRFAVRSEVNGHKVASVEVRDSEMLVRFYHDDDVSRNFTFAFGLLNPSQNPTTILYGFVYHSGEKGLFQLDEHPVSLREKALSKASHYAKAGNVYFVSFLRGDMEPQWLRVISMQKVLPGGKLGDDVGEQMLMLGNIENERTM